MGEPMTEWFDKPDPAGVPDADEPGLRFSCTMCGNCCTGPPGYVHISASEIEALSRRFRLDRDRFLMVYTHMTSRGISLNEKQSEHGLDCVFLDRQTIPGRAICGVYEDRPAQCHTWPFWSENLRSLSAWKRAATHCPGMDKGTLASPQQIRVLRDRTPA